jgi:phosphoglycerate-specific signal transduction histidine kinase
VSSALPLPRDDRQEEISAAAHELSESLAAVANYIEAASRLMRRGAQRDGAPCEILDKASAQTQRAHAIAQRLRRLMR